jgi:glycosyltransferase involved in cell wall biosynthesis
MMDGGACRVTAHAHRTWHVASVLRRAGHEIALYTVSQNLAPHDPRVGLVEPRVKDGLPYENLDMRMGDVLGCLAERYERFHPDAVIGVSTEPASWACRMRPTVPLWADLHGWVMAEAQVKAVHDGSDDILSHFWRRERPVLRRADKISAVSTPQRFALLGELATVGRLNRCNAQYDLVVTIPSSVDPATIGPPRDDGHVAHLVGGGGAFVVLWSGGFNTWTDPVTLFEGLEWAMASDPAVHFVATGGTLPGHADAVFEAFRERVSQSAHRSRYHLTGWVPAEEFPSYLGGSHLAICVDFPCVETLMGTRTRLLEAMAAGLPVLMTRGTELSVELERAGVAWVVAPREPRVLGEKILEAARTRDRTAAIGKRACRFVAEEYSVARTLEPLVQWAQRPFFAPDNAIKRTQSPTIVEAFVNRLEADASALDDVSDIQAMARAQQDLERLRSRWPLRLWRRLKKMRKPER